jgi:hypothetical protein
MPGGSLSSKRLYDKYYNIDPATIENVRDYVTKMLNILNKYAKYPPKGEE